DGVLAGRVDIEHLNRGGVVKGVHELIHEIARARVAMRLEDDVDRAIATIPRGADGSAYLSGMVAVVVDNRDATGTAANLEAAVDAVKGSQPGGNGFGRNLQLGRDGHRCGGVKHVVDSGHVQF